MKIKIRRNPSREADHDMKSNRSKRASLFQSIQAHPQVLQIRVSRRKEMRVIIIIKLETLLMKNIKYENLTQIKSLLGDGTFGRVLECEKLSDGQLYAVKVIRPVARYLESAKIEADIIANIHKQDKKNESHCVRMLEYFDFVEDGKKYMALIFEKLGLSLYEFVKANKFRGKVL
jgi:serine/threonine protein kinase